MAYIEWDYTVITSMVENQGWSLPDKNTEDWDKFNDELGECMRKVGIVFEKYCDFKPDIGEGVNRKEPNFNSDVTDESEFDDLEQEKIEVPAFLRRQAN